jgi:hypothetical protein
MSVAVFAGGASIPRAPLSAYTLITNRPAMHNAITAGNHRNCASSPVFAMIASK